MLNRNQTSTLDRMLTLNRALDAAFTDRISAEHKDGLLTITVPKAEMAQARRIDVK